MEVTLQDLKDRGACPDQLYTFYEFLGGRKSVALTPQNLERAREMSLSIDWFLENFADRLRSGHSRDCFLARPEWAYLYAYFVDKRPGDDTRKAASQNPSIAYFYAKHVDLGPHEDTLAAVLENPELTYCYAFYVIGGPSDETREAVLSDSYTAYKYAMNVDQRPREDTRAAAHLHSLQYDIWAEKQQEEE